MALNVANWTDKQLDELADLLQASDYSAVAGFISENFLCSDLGLTVGGRIMTDPVPSELRVTVNGTYPKSVDLSPGIFQVGGVISQIDSAQTINLLDSGNYCWGGSGEVGKAATADRWDVICVKNKPSYGGSAYRWFVDDSVSPNVYTKQLTNTLINKADYEIKVVHGADGGGVPATPGYWTIAEIFIDSTSPTAILAGNIYDTAVVASVSGSANAAVTTTATKLIDTRQSLMTNAYVGAVITCNGKTMTITSNDTNSFTGSSWSGGGTPGDGYTWATSAIGGSHASPPNWSETTRVLRLEFWSSLFGVDHYLTGSNAGHHKLGGWHIGSTQILVTGDELNRALSGAGLTVTASNLTTLTNGSNLPPGVLHSHGGAINMLATAVRVLSNSTSVFDWMDVDLSAYLPSNATFAYVTMEMQIVAAISFGGVCGAKGSIRPKGSSETIYLPRVGGLATTGNGWWAGGLDSNTCFVGLGAGRIFQAKWELTNIGSPNAVGLGFVGNYIAHFYIDLLGYI